MNRNICFAILKSWTSRLLKLLFLYVRIFPISPNPLPFELDVLCEWPLGLLPSILSSVTSPNGPQLRVMCQIHLSLVLMIFSNSSLFSSTITSTSSFAFISTHPTSPIQTLNAAILQISNAFGDHVVKQFERQFQTTALVIRIITMVNSSFRLVKTIFYLIFLILFVCYICHYQLTWNQNKKFAT